jgi:hypothetical protein
MKKNVAVLLVLFFLCARVYSLEESWISWGFESGNSFETKPNSLGPYGTYIGALGLNFSNYTFPDNRTFGFFLHNSILYTGLTPVKKGVENFRGIQNESSLGAAFRFDIGGRFKLLLNLGLNLLLLKSLYQNVPEEGSCSTETLNFGFGGGAALKYETGDNKFFCGIGLRTTLHCLNRTSVLSGSGEESRWYWNLLLGIKPYISFGLNLFNTGTRLGLPEKQKPVP